MIERHPCRWTLATIVVVAWFSLAAAEKAPECLHTPVAVVLTRPVVSNAPDTTLCGVAESEYGWSKQRSGGGVQRDAVTTGFRLGVTKNLDFHWAGDIFLRMAAPGQEAAVSFGDSWLGAKYRLRPQASSSHVPALGLMYMGKVPSANDREGFGSGADDHVLSFLVSENVGRLHFDYNTIGLLVGRANATRYDHSTGFSLAGYVPCTKRITLLAEGYGYTELNASTRGYASVTTGVLYTVRPNLVLDVGIDAVVMAGVPGKRFFAGVTYAMGNVYRWLAARDRSLDQIESASLIGGS